MDHVLLILLLASGGAGSTEARDAVAAALTDFGGARVRVVVGPDALKELDRRGLKEVDLVSSPNIGEQLTAHDPDLAVVRLERRDTGGDRIIESQVWLRGHLDRHVAIAGPHGESNQGAIKGVLAILGPWLPDQGPTTPGDTRLGQLADGKDWAGLLAAASAAEPSPRHGYYRVLALVRLGRLAEAATAVERLRVQFGGHFLVDAAAALLPIGDPAAAAAAESASAAAAATMAAPDLVGSATDDVLR